MARPALPTSSSDFALPASAISPDNHHRDEPLAKTRRQSILASHLSSPLAESFTLRVPQTQEAASDSDRDRMSTDTPPSSGSEYPPPPPPPAAPGRARRRSPPLTPPRRRASEASEPQKLRRLSHPLRPPRLLNLLSEAEARPEESEARGEAVFQRLVASGTELAAFPSPRNAHDRGRFPEEAPSEDGDQGDESDDDSDEEDNAFMAASAPIPIGKPRTPAGSVCGDDPAMRVSESPSAGSMMDVDVPSISPSVSSMSVASTPAQQWRSTPPPTSSTVRSNKRKHDDRYDPYPSAKRRAVSPSIGRAGSPSSFMRGYVAARGVSPHLHSPRATPRMPLAIPKSIPGSSCSSAASSPTVGGLLTNGGSVLFSPGTTNPSNSQTSNNGNGNGMHASSSSSSSSGMNSLAGSPNGYTSPTIFAGSPSSYSSGLSFARPVGMTASPTLRASMGLASPILRPVVRSWLKEGEEPEVEGAGERVNGLTLGER
ncbi:hypothetical protein FB107DRAFT_245362 [Schizophyllum commune]